MAYEEISRGRSTKYSDTLDELLGIRSKKEIFVKRESLPNQAEPGERPTTRHGRNREAVPAVTVTELSSSFKPDTINKSGVIVERWQRESEEGEDDDDIEDTSSDSRSSSNSESGNESTTKMHRMQTTNNEYESVINESGQKTTPPRPTDSTLLRESSIERPTGSLDDEKNFDQSKKTIRKAVEKTTAVERPESVENDVEGSKSNTFWIRSRSSSSGVKKHSTTTTRLFDENSSTGKASYEAWLREKMKQEKEKRRWEEEKKEEERRVKEERKREAERNYEIWKQRTDDAIREKRRQQRKKAKALEKEKNEERKRKNEEATKMFQAWKNDRLQRLVAERKERLQSKEKDELKKKREIKTKNNAAQKAFSAWCEKKKTRNEEAQRKLLESRRTQETQSRNEKEYKEALAKEAYEVWLQIKESERRFKESLQGRIMKFDETACRLHSVPWIPPSNVIPRQFISSCPRKHRSANRFSSLHPASYKKSMAASSRSKSALR